MPSARPLSGFLITPARDLLASLLKIPATRVLLIATIAWLTIFGLLEERLWRDPHSGFFESATVYDLHYSAFRRDEAQAWAAEQERGAMPTHEHVSAPHEPAICAGLVTYNRPQRQYLNETIGSMLEGLTSDERRALDVRLLFAHSEPSVHPEWNRTWLRAIDSWSGYDDLTKSELERVLIAEKERNFYVKGVIDYTYILNECLTHTTAPYIAIFEDDIIFAEGWLAKTAVAMLELSKGSKASTNWLYLRLFYTETSLGWDEEIDFWYRNMRLTFALAIVSMLTFLLSIRAWSARLRPRLDLATIAVLALIVAPAFTQLVFMVGKYNLFPLQGVVRIDRFGCCTQGLVFPRAKAIDLLHALEGRDGQTDSMIEAYADEQGLERYALAPQVLQHVGLVSSRDNLAINTQSTWAFWFEAQRPEVLKREHWKLAAEVDWKVLRRSASA